MQFFGLHPLSTPSEWPVYGKRMFLFSKVGWVLSPPRKMVEAVSRSKSVEAVNHQNTKTTSIFCFFWMVWMLFVCALVVFWNDHHFTFTGIFVVYYQNKKIIYWRLASDWNRTNKAWNLFDIFCIKNQYCRCAGGSFFFLVQRLFSSVRFSLRPLLQPHTERLAVSQMDAEMLLRMLR